MLLTQVKRYLKNLKNAPVLTSKTADKIIAKSSLLFKSNLNIKTLYIN